MGPKTTVSLDASCSSFVSSFQWQLTPPSTSTATVIGSNTARASFQVDTHGNYDVNLRVTGLGGETSDAPLFGVVNNNIPAGRAVPSQAVDLNVLTAIDVLSGSTLGDPPTVINAVTAMGVGLAATPNATTQQIEVTASNITGGSVTYSIRDEDNDVSADVTFPVTVNASISIGSMSGSVQVNSTNQPLNLPVVSAQGQPFRIELWNGAAWVASGPVATSLPSRGGLRAVRSHSTHALEPPVPFSTRHRARPSRRPARHRILSGIAHASLRIRLAVRTRSDVHRPDHGGDELQHRGLDTSEQPRDLPWRGQNGCTIDGASI